MDDARPLKIGMLGLGTVGSGVAQVLMENAAAIAQRCERRLDLARVLVRDLNKARGFRLAPELLTTEPAAVLEDPEIGAVVEVIGGVEPARTLILRALEAGKHVVSSNKEAIAKCSDEFHAAARAHGVNLYYEAAVGGGIPVLHGIKNSLVANNLSKVSGIVNGTTNYILSRMYETGASFDEALAEAQERGFAEPDPTSDVDGYDAAYKLAILASMAFGSRFRYEDVYFEGIRRLTAEDFASAKALKCVIKLVALAREHSEGDVELRVHPVMIDEWHPLAAVGGCYNAVYVEGNYIEQTMFYGPGAGPLPTASAIVGDLADIAMGLELGRSHPSQFTHHSDKPVRPMERVETEYYLRLVVADRPGVLAVIAGICGEEGVSLKSVEQGERGGAKARLVLITHDVAEASMQRALNRIRELDTVLEVESFLRVGI